MNSTENMGEEIARALELAGIGTTGQHDFLFFSYFSERSAAEQFLQRLESEGFNCKVEKSAEGAEWMCTARKRLVIDTEALSELGRRFAHLAWQLDGQFEGWERVPAEGEAVPEAISLMQAVNLYEEGDLQQAAAVLEDLARSPASAYDVWPLLGLVQFKLHNYQRAADCFAEDIRKQGESSEGLVNYASALFKLGRLEEAAVRYRAALLLDPGEGSAHYGLACVAAAAKRKSEALAALRQAFQFDPTLIEQAESDSDLDPLRTDQQFEQLLKNRH